jgi:hypothetical protein
MTDTVAVSVPDQGLLARAMGMIFAPAATFRTVVSAPRPVMILLFVALVTGLAAAGPQFTEHGRLAALAMQRQQTERFSGQPVTEAQAAQMERVSRYTPYLSVVGVFIVLPIFALLFTAVYWAVFNTILGGTAAFKQVLGIVTHSSVIGALAAVVSAPIIYLQDKAPSFAGPFNLGALVPMLDPASFPVRFLNLVGVFTIWQIVVTGIGLSVLYRKKSTGITTALVCVYLLVMAAIAAAFPSFTTPS